ncbi:MAG: hypothetical protein QF858_03805 [Candidatus Pacebacteria bacterium]|jgi:hypothetical protein|nr:hypothetical protein [Candidatus Paceibacterota bacterium]
MKQPIWHPPAMIPIYLKLSLGILGSSKEQLINLKAVKGKAHILSDNEINRCLKLYTEMNEDAWVFLEQCNRWLKLSLTDKQKKQVLEIKAATIENEAVNNEILTLVKEYQPQTINKIMEMDPAELALKVLSGEIDSPLKE